MGIVVGIGASRSRGGRSCYVGCVMGKSEIGSPKGKRLVKGECGNTPSPSSKVEMFQLDCAQLACTGQGMRPFMCRGCTCARRCACESGGGCIGDVLDPYPCVQTRPTTVWEDVALPTHVLRAWHTAGYQSNAFGLLKGLPLHFFGFCARSNSAHPLDKHQGLTRLLDAGGESKGAGGSGSGCSGCS